MRDPYLSVVGIVTLLTLAAPLFAQAAIPDTTGPAFKPNLSTRSLPIPGGTPKQGRAYRQACAGEPLCVPLTLDGSSSPSLDDRLGLAGEVTPLGGHFNRL